MFIVRCNAYTIFHYNLVYDILRYDITVTINKPIFRSIWFRHTLNIEHFFPIIAPLISILLLFYLHKNYTKNIDDFSLLIKK